MPGKKSNPTEIEASFSREIRRLKKDLSSKEQELRDQIKRADNAELKNELLNMLVDIAQDELHIDLRKNLAPSSSTASLRTLGS